ncbi:MAG: hypothetical protein AAFY60_14940, partial [Myxococcota bacterium]
LTDAGCSWLSEALLRSGGSTERIVQSHFHALSLVEGVRLKARIDELEPNISADTEYQLRLITESAIERTTDWLMRQPRKPKEEFAALLAESKGVVLEHLEPEQLEALSAISSRLSEAGSLAEEVVRLRAIDRMIDIASVAERASVDVARAGRFHRIVGGSTGLLDLVRRDFDEEEHSDETPASFALRDRIRRHLVAMAATVAQQEKSPETIGSRTLDFLESLGRDLVPFQGGAEQLSNLAIAADRVERAVDALRERYS